MIPEATRDVPATKSPVRSSITPIVSFVPCISITSGAINAGMTRKSLMKWTAVNTPIEAVSAATRGWNETYHEAVMPRVITNTEPMRAPRAPPTRSSFQVPCKRSTRPIVARM